MAATYIDLHQAEDVRDVIHRVVEALSSGKIVAFPTETVYGLAASALQPAAVERLWEIKGRDPSKPFALAIKSAEEAMDYVPAMSATAARLARRCWPGPVTLVIDDDPQSAVHQLDPVVVRATTSRGTTGLRVPDDELVLQILRLCAGPVVLTSANKSGQPEPPTGAGVREQLGEEIDFIVDGGKTRYQGPSTVLKVDQDEVTILREGVVKESVVRELTHYVAVVVCTGNTCRSPMAEAMLKQCFAGKLNCEIDQLHEHGVTILSAGIAAMPGAPAAPQSVEVMKKQGLDITGHSSQPVTERLAHCSDIIFTLTNGHRQAIISQWPQLQDTVTTLRPDGGDIADPVGSPVAVYEQCSDQIQKCISHWCETLDFSQFKKRI